MGLGLGVWSVLWLLAWWAHGGTDLGLWLEHPALSGVVVVLAYELRVARRRLSQQVAAVEAVAWNWRRMMQGLLWGPVGALGMWGLAYLFAVLRGDPASVHDHWRLYLPLFVGLCSLALGFDVKLLTQEKSRDDERAKPSPSWQPWVGETPNRGIWLSLRNALWAAFLTLVSASGVFFVSFGFWGQQPLGIRWIQASLHGGGFLAAVGFLWFGGMDFLAHWVLRAALTFSGPSRLVSFLDRGVRLGLLRRVGGGFQFTHPRLLEYFAENSNLPSPSVPRDRFEEPWMPIGPRTPIEVRVLPTERHRPQNPSPVEDVDMPATTEKISLERFQRLVAQEAHDRSGTDLIRQILERNPGDSWPAVGEDEVEVPLARLRQFKASADYHRLASFVIGLILDRHLLERFTGDEAEQVMEEAGLKEREKELFRVPTEADGPVDTFRALLNQLLENAPRGPHQPQPIDPNRRDDGGG